MVRNHNRYGCVANSFLHVGTAIFKGHLDIFFPLREKILIWRGENKFFSRFFP